MMSQIRISAIKGTTFPEGAGIRPCRPALAVCSAPPQGDPPGSGSLQDVFLINITVSGFDGYSACGGLPLPYVPLRRRAILPDEGSLQDVLSYKEKGFYRLPCLIIFPHFYTGRNIFLPGVIRNILSTVCTPHEPQSIPYSYGYIS